MMRCDGPTNSPILSCARYRNGKKHVLECLILNLFSYLEPPTLCRALPPPQCGLRTDQLEVGFLTWLLDALT